MKKFLAIMLALGIFTGSVQADITTPTQQGSMVAVSGKVATEKAGVDVTIVVLKSGVSKADFLSKTLEETVNYMDQTTTAEGGLYNFQIFLADTVADKEIFLCIEEGDYFIPNIDGVKYTPTAMVIKAVGDLNTAYSSGNAVEKNRENVILALQSPVLDLAVTGAMDDFLQLKNKNFVADYFIEKIKQTPYNTDTDEKLSASIVDIRLQFKTSVAMAMLQNQLNNVQMDGVLNKYKTELGLNLEKYDILDNKTVGKEKSLVHAVMSEFPLGNVVEIQKAFNVGVSVAMLNRSNSWNSLKTAIDEHSTVLELDISATSTFSKISNKELFFKEYVKNVPFNSYNSLKSVFLSTVNTVYEKESKPSNPGGGSGGGGGSSSGGGGSSVIEKYTPVTVPGASKNDENADKNKGENDSKFADLGDVEWAVESIEKLANLGVVSGNDGKFEPLRSVTRGEFLKMVMNGLAIDVAESESVFADVDANEWYCKYVMTAYNAGIVQGSDGNLFAPNDYVTRQDMAVILCNSLNFKNVNIEGNVKTPFVDEAEIADYAKKSVNLLYSANIINGYENGLFKPNVSATRAESAKLICEIIQKVEK